MVTLLLAIIGLFSFLFVVTGVSGYVTAVENTVLAQKAGLALARITTELGREMEDIVNIDALTGSPTYIKYLVQTNPVAYRHIRLVGPDPRKKILLAPGANPPPPLSDAVLIGGVSVFTLDYRKFKTDGSGDTDPWIVADGMDQLAKIVITLTLFIDDTNTDTFTFTTTVTPPVVLKLIRTTMAPGPGPVKGKPHVS